MADITKFAAVRDGVRGNFALNKMHTTTGDFFTIDVVHMVPMVPKDVVNLNVHTFIDAAPNPYPIDGSCKYGMYAFFVPYRLLWDDWKYYMSGLQNLTQPYFTLGDLWTAFHDNANPWKDDYFESALKYISNIRNLGAIVPFLKYENLTDIPSSWRNLKFNGYALRAINRIWWDWYRDKAHISDASINSYVFSTGGHMSVVELIGLCAPKFRCYPKNYITTAFEAPQEGAVSLVPVEIGKDVNSSGFPVSSNNEALYLKYNNAKVGKSTSFDTTYANNYIGQVSPSELKLSTSIQNIREKMLLSGKTVLSRMKAFFNTSPTIEELQMCNYLGGHEEDLFFDTTTATVSTTAQGQSGQNASVFGYHPAFGNVAGQKSMHMRTKDNNGFGLENVSYKSDETGFLVVCGSITPVVQYFEGLPRDWFRGTDTFASDKFDYFHSDMENQPLQPVLNYEVCCSPDIATQIDPKGVFGFQQNYVDYKLELDSLGGQYCLDPDTQNSWWQMHLGRSIADLVAVSTTIHGGQYSDYLNPEYLTQSSEFDRAFFDDKFIFGDNHEDHFRMNHKIQVMANRPMSEVTLPSVDSALSQVANKKKIETGGFRL